MEEKKELNLVEILKDCPKGTKLYSVLYGEVELDSVMERDSYPIYLVNRKEGILSVSVDGKTLAEFDGECTLFPSKDNRDWSTFKIEKPKWNPDTLQPFDKVLVRDYDTDPWKGDFFVSSDWPVDNEYYAYMAVSSYYKMCIPYNDDTKHLLGTSDEAPEYYRQ